MSFRRKCGATRRSGSPVTWKMRDERRNSYDSKAALPVKPPHRAQFSGFSEPGCQPGQALEGAHIPGNDCGHKFFKRIASRVRVLDNTGLLAIDITGLIFPHPGQSLTNLVISTLERADEQV